MKKTQFVKSLNFKVQQDDSHASNCAHLLQDNLISDFKVSSFVKPGARMNEVINRVREELEILKSNLVMVWGGVIDIRKNNRKETLNSVSKFVNENKELNVVLINSPPTFDIVRESCVNQEVIKFNRQIRKVMEYQPKVKILELKLDRKCFTTHG